MRFLHLLIGDSADGADPESLRDEWVNPDHIQTVQHYLTDEPAGPLLWLELTLLGGRRRYLPVGHSATDRAAADAAEAIQRLLVTASAQPSPAYRVDE